MYATRHVIVRDAIRDEIKLAACATRTNGVGAIGYFVLVKSAYGLFG